MTTSFELVLSVALSLEDWTIDGVKLQVILGSRKVQQTKSIDVSLILGRL
jgi:hypothetical protein